MPRKKSLMPRVKGERAAPQPKMTRLEKLYPLNDREIGTDVYRYNSMMRDFGYKWLEYAALSFEGRSSSVDYSRPLVDSSASQSKIDDTISHLLDKRREATRFRSMVGARTAEILDAIIYHDMTVEIAATKILKRDNSAATNDMRGRFYQALEVFASLKRFSGT